MLQEPLTLLYTFSMPLTKSSPCEMSNATNSVGLVRPMLRSVNCWCLARQSASRSAMLLIFDTVAMAKRPRCELTITGCASVSLMTPIPTLPFISSRSLENLGRKCEFWMLWMF